MKHIKISRLKKLEEGIEFISTFVRNKAHEPVPINVINENGIVNLELTNLLEQISEINSQRNYLLQKIMEQME